MKGTHLLFPLLMLLATQFLNAQTARQRSVQVSATVQTNPAKIDFSWPADNTANQYTVYKKALNGTNWGNPIATLPGTATTYTDSNVFVGTGYEYAFYKKEFDDVVQTVCVPSGSTLTFDITDMYGVGLCCSFGFGKYEVAGCGQTFAYGDNFGWSNSHTFTVCNESPCTDLTITLTPDMFPNSTSWTLTEVGTGNELATSGAVGNFISERPKYGYIYAGIQVPAIESHGTILIVSESSIQNTLATELSELRSDCILDGWKVKQLTVNAFDPVTFVKSQIQQVWQNTPDLEAVYLVGHVPVPYSGDIYPDTHTEHRGAWAADTYYGEMNGNWTDNTVNRSTAFFEYNHNVPGDGRFDQDSIPSKMELQIGRVDLSNLQAFSLNETELTRNYLNKSHNFKVGNVTTNRRGLVDDNFMHQFAAPAASGFRNFAPMFGANNIDEVDFLTTLNSQPYLWAYGCGSGSQVSCEGVATTSEIAGSNLQNVFTMLFGSQFGDWNHENNILRAPLAQGTTLTNCWAGSPAWTFHHMAMGYPIGYSTIRTMNADIDDYLPGPQLTHLALMGDPTLRLHPVKPAVGVDVFTIGNQNMLTWLIPANQSSNGFYIYRSNTFNGDYQRIGQASGNSFTDTNPVVGKNVYMVRNTSIETTGSGTYHNLSLGAVDSINFVVSTEEIELAAITLSPNPTHGHFQIDFADVKFSNAICNIYNPLGQLIYSKILEPVHSGIENIDLSNVDSGLYLVEIKGDDFQSIQKLVIEK